ncbi:hypothetical protein BCR33DRAFT_640228, partial [Rhizoclosmatium globosum]
LSGNAAVFPTPLQAIAEIVLPIPISELSKILVVTFSGPAKPSDSETSTMLKQASFLYVRGSYILEALQWLIKYNRHYQNIKISSSNLAGYSQCNGQYPLPIFFQQSATMPQGAEPSVHQTENHPVEEAATEDSVSFAISGIGEEEFDLLSQQQKKFLALQHVKMGGDVLEIGRDDGFVSMFDNPTAWEKLFVHLHPFGYG